MGMAAPPISLFDALAPVGMYGDDVITQAERAVDAFSVHPKDHVGGDEFAAERAGIASRGKGFEHHLSSVHGHSPY
jgi:hypothetical protein